MLQQTQANRVIPKYEAFIEKFPSLQKLSAANKLEVLTLWSGLGYNRRAVWLQEAATTILEYDDFPEDPKDLIKIKGIGKYTSNSIPIFAFNAELVTVDTNIEKILIHHQFADSDTKEKELYDIARLLMPKGESRDWHNALMDYGSISFNQRSPKKSKQSKFKGSNREIRGNIIKKLTTGKKFSNRQLMKEFSNNGTKINQILDDLVNEGLIQQSGRQYFI